MAEITRMRMLLMLITSSWIKIQLNASERFLGNFFMGKAFRHNNITMGKIIRMNKF